MKRYSFGVAIYPDGSPGQDARIKEYVKKAHALGCGEVFSSLHIPELGFTENTEAMLRLSEATHALDMQLSLDVSGRVARGLLADPYAAGALQALRADWLRLDFGFTEQETAELVHRLKPPGLMLNASVLAACEVRQRVEFLRSTCPGLKLRAHHNFYPMPETGLALDFMAQRARYYAPYSIPVTACVPAFAQPRLPMCKGLPTVEAHRHLPPGEAALQLLATGAVADILIGDPFASDEELAAVALCCHGGTPALRVSVAPALSQGEWDMAFAATHTARPDEAAYSVRSLTSRGMAAPGCSVPARHMGPRARGDVVCNEHALRYSGEVQVMKCARPATGQQNLVGRVLPQDLWMLELLQPGADFRLIPIS